MFNYFKRDQPAPDIKSEEWIALPQPAYDSHRRAGVCHHCRVRFLVGMYAGGQQGAFQPATGPLVP